MNIPELNDLIYQFEKDDDLIHKEREQSKQEIASEEARGWSVPKRHFITNSEK